MFTELLHLVHIFKMARFKDAYCSTWYEEQGQRIVSINRLPVRIIKSVSGG